MSARGFPPRAGRPRCGGLGIPPALAPHPESLPSEGSPEAVTGPGPEAQHTEVGGPPRL